MSAHNSDESFVFGAVFALLLILTAVTIVSARFGMEPLMGVVVAMGVASAKAGLIGIYFMRLRREPVVVWCLVVAGISAVATLAIGILPDMALKLQ